MIIQHTLYNKYESYTWWSFWGKHWYICIFNFCSTLSMYQSPEILYGRQEPDIPTTLRPRQNGRHFTDDIFKRIFMNENIWIPIKISLKFVHKGSIDNIPALVQIMAWRHPGDKPLSEPIMVNLPTHICVTRHLNGRNSGYQQPLYWPSSHRILRHAFDAFSF